MQCQTYHTTKFTRKGISYDRDENDVVLLHDDLLATGGTMKAACELVKKLKPKKVYINFIIELKELNGKAMFGDDVEVESVLSL